MHTSDQLLPCLMSSDVDRIRVYSYMLARIYPSFVNGWFRARRDGTRPRRPVEGSCSWSRPRAVRGMLVRHMGVLSEQFYGLGLGGLVRGSHAVGLVCRRTGTEARYTGASLAALGRVYSRFPIGCGCPAGQPQRAGPVGWRVPRPRETSWRSSCVERRGGVGSCYRRGSPSKQGSPGRFAARLPRARSA